MNERDSLLVLNAVNGLGNAGIRKLLACYGSARDILFKSEDELSQDQVLSAKVLRALVLFPREEFIAREYELMRRHDVGVVSWLDEAYPDVLREIPDAPVVLYTRGDLSVCCELSIAIVGSRRASTYGTTTARIFAGRFAELGLTVVSGMARGIDTAAHQGVVAAGGLTAAVLGCGLATVYPPENKNLMNEIARSGVVISEFPMTTPPVPFNFPRRNRIISGLSLGVIVVEAAQRSGALITADFALEQGREVYAVPGKIDQASASGTLNLIKQGAKMVTCIEDILEDLKPHLEQFINPIPEAVVSVEHSRHQQSADELSASEQAVYGYITDRPIHIDELMDRCGASVPVMSVLLQLELKRRVKQLPGKLFVR